MFALLNLYPNIYNKKIERVCHLSVCLPVLWLIHLMLARRLPFSQTSQTGKTICTRREALFLYGLHLLVGKSIAEKKYSEASLPTL